DTAARNEDILALPSTGFSAMLGRAVEIAGSIHNDAGDRFRAVQPAARIESVEDRLRAVGGEFEDGAALPARLVPTGIGGAVQISGCVHDQRGVGLAAISAVLDRTEIVEHG